MKKVSMFAVCVSTLLFLGNGANGMIPQNSDNQGSNESLHEYSDNENEITNQASDPISQTVSSQDDEVINDVFQDVNDGISTSSNPENNEASREHQVSDPISQIMNLQDVEVINDAFQNFNDSISQIMDPQTVQGHMASIDAEIQRCEQGLNDLLVQLQSIPDGDNTRVEPLVPEIDRLTTQIRNLQETGNLLQHRKDELQPSLRSQMISRIEEALRRGDASSNNLFKNAETRITLPTNQQNESRDILQRIGKELERFGRRIGNEADRFGHKVEREARNFNEGTVKPLARNIKRFLKKI